MTTKELNKAIKNLNSELYRMSFEDLAEFFNYVETKAAPEFKRLYHADDKFVSHTKETALIMFRLNLKHRFIPFHQFGINIELF